MVIFQKVIKSYLCFYISYPCYFSYNRQCSNLHGLVWSRWSTQYRITVTVLYHLSVEQQWTTPPANSCGHRVLFLQSHACRTAQRSICSFCTLESMWGEKNHRFVMFLGSITVFTKRKFQSNFRRL